MIVNYPVYYYCIDDFNDVGFGCSYRNAQTILSSYKNNYKDTINIPRIQDMLQYFNSDYKEKLKESKKTALWIEPYQISEYLKKNFQIQGKNILYVTQDQDIERIMKTDISIYIESKVYNHNNFSELIELISNHFANSKLPIVIDDGVYSYCMIYSHDQPDKIILIDPHTQRNDSSIKIKDISFIKESFWMIYLPITY